MSWLSVGNTRLGDGSVKVCVPIAYERKEQILAEAKAIAQSGCADIAEWRIDWYEGVFDEEAMRTLSPRVKKVLDGKPLLVTFRSKREGGNRAIEPQKYEALLRSLISYNCLDLLDVELGMGRTCVGGLIELAHQSGVPVIVSMHDFRKTPDAAELVSVMEQMADQGADVCKVAVMPQCCKDVAELLQATGTMKERHPDQLLITMSMGAKGAVSRICGGCFGSVMTFGSMGKASAPGQVEAAALKSALTALESCFQERTSV